MLQVIASSGIDDTIALWVPMGGHDASAPMSPAELYHVVADNQRRLQASDETEMDGRWCTLGQRSSPGCVPTTMSVSRM